MRKKMCICDICRESYWRNASSGAYTKFYHVKVALSHVWDNDLSEYPIAEKKLDICGNCVNDFVRWAKKHRDILRGGNDDKAK